MIYEPQEDSFLLRKWVKRLAFGKVLDMGTGSGIQADAAREKGLDVVTVDINPEVKADIHSDLFENVSGKFDTIIFNPPYLPEDEYDKDVANVGGKEGYETILRFLDQAYEHLTDEGIILIVFSTLSKPEVILSHAKKKYKVEILEKLKIPFEELYCVMLKRL